MSNRFNIIMDIKGLLFSEAWKNRVVNVYDDQPIFIVSPDDIIRAKKTTGQSRDLLEVEVLKAGKNRDEIMTEQQKQTGQQKERVIMSRLVRRDQQDRSFDLEFWEKVGAAGRFAAAWQMIREVQLMRGQSGELPRMQKSVVRIIRRSQAAESDESSNE